MQKFDCDRLKEPRVVLEYTNKLNEYLSNSTRSTEEKSIEDRWSYFLNGIKESAQQVLGTVANNSNRCKDWYDEDCKRATEHKNKLYKKMHQQKFTRSSFENYCEARKEEKKIHGKVV